jgi:hypothetical protein
MGHTGRSANEDNFVDGVLIDFGVTEELPARLKNSAKEVLAKFLETSMGEGSVEVDTFKQNVNLD